MWWTKKMHNAALKQDIESYGKDSFEIKILEHSKTAKELGRLEDDYAKKYNAYLPNGYNKQSCLKTFSSKCRLSKLEQIELNDPLGSDVIITDPINFCTQHSLSPKCIYLILKGKRFFHKGWTIKGNKNKSNPKMGKYTLYDQKGQRFDVNNLSAFCREKGLHYDRIRQMTAGYIRSSQGYGLSKGCTSNQKWQYIVTLTKDGQDKLLTNIGKQSKEIGINHTFVYQLIHGKINSYQGWVLKSFVKQSLHEFRKQNI